MRSRILPAIGAGVVAIAVATAFSSSATASNTSVGTSTKSQVVQHTSPQAGTCYSQLDNDNGIGIVSQDFEASFDIYDSQGADDFKLKKDCKMKDVEFDGAYFNGSGPCDSFNVYIYANAKKPPKSKPGKLLYSFTGLAYTGGTPYHIDLPKTVLKAGTYWVSIQCVMNFSTGGEWGWNTNNTVRTDPAKWQNPGNGFSTGCTKYQTLTTCIPSGEGGDFSFSITK